jgi:hypothetical protein
MGVDQRKGEGPFPEDGIGVGIEVGRSVDKDASPGSEELLVDIGFEWAMDEGIIFVGEELRAGVGVGCPTEVGIRSAGKEL